jgi:hypothetical protein
MANTYKDTIIYLREKVSGLQMEWDRLDSVLYTLYRYLDDLDHHIGALQRTIHKTPAHYDSPLQYVSEMAEREQSNATLTYLHQQRTRLNQRIESILRQQEGIDTQCDAILVRQRRCMHSLRRTIVDLVPCS